MEITVAKDCCWLLEDVISTTENVKKLMALRNSWPLLMIYMARLLDYKQICKYHLIGLTLLRWNAANMEMVQYTDPIHSHQQVTFSVTVKSIMAAACGHKDSDMMADFSCKLISSDQKLNSFPVYAFTTIWRDWKQPLQSTDNCLIDPCIKKKNQLHHLPSPWWLSNNTASVLQIRHIHWAAPVLVLRAPNNCSTGYTPMTSCFDYNFTNCSKSDITTAHTVFLQSPGCTALTPKILQ